MLPVLGTVIAIVTGHLARSEIQRHPDGMEGDGLALAGLILGYLSFLLVFLVLAILLFGVGGLLSFLRL